MNKYWFKSKKYGWGISWPIAWQGWVATVLLSILMSIALFIDLPYYRTPRLILKAELRLFLDCITLSILFLLLLHDKVEGGLKWRWGED